MEWKWLVGRRTLTKQIAAGASFRSILSHFIDLSGVYILFLLSRFLCFSILPTSSIPACIFLVIHTRQPTDPPAITMPEDHPPQQPSKASEPSKDEDRSLTKLPNGVVLDKDGKPYASLAPPITPTNNTPQLPPLHLGGLLARPNQASQIQPFPDQTRPTPTSIKPRLSARRRSPRPVHLDAPPQPHGQLPGAGEQCAAERDAHVPGHVLAAVPVLGVCGRFPRVDGGG